MPQMAPLLWLNLFIFFSISFMFFLILNYFLKTPHKMESPSSDVMSPNLNWKW
uniref:ATP synthase complex subunit 8 n=1 Tax=Paratya australiensis TaxID=159741 RepID=A0A0U2DWA4_PARAS|nr:ATP synthase F0 subunit 8 [Paratya australiensis]AKQ09512.1 ATP synthase F0 subunit 8 [Paratya australiensis]